MTGWSLKTPFLRLAAASMLLLWLLTANSCDAPTPSPSADPHGSATDSGERFGAPLELTLSWGGGASAGPHGWDGELSLDCGRISALRFIAGEDGDSDGLAPTQQKGQASSVRWRSTVQRDRDGLRATLLPCLGAPGSTLRVTTPQRTWRARLRWSQDEFVSLPVGDDGERLEIRLRANRHAPAIASPSDAPTVR